MNAKERNAGIIIIIVVLLFGAFQVIEDCGSIPCKSGGIAFRTFNIIRDQAGNIPIETATDIPNTYECRTMDGGASDLNGDEVMTAAATLLKDGENGFKVFQIDEDATMYDMNFTKELPVSNLQYVWRDYFCVGPSESLNRDFVKNFGNI